MSAKVCPLLLKKSLAELFPTPEVIGNESLTLITLKSHLETEQGAKNFVLAAREVCSRLRMNGFWADFMNPFSGRPFYSYVNGKILYKVDERFRGLGMRFENINDCVVISADNALDQALDAKGFNGTVFSNVFPDIIRIQGLIGE